MRAELEPMSTTAKGRSSGSGSGTAFTPRCSHTAISRGLGFDLDLALQRLPQRNVYRQTLIAFDVAVRGKEQATDEIRADIRDRLRNLRALEQGYAIELKSVANAKRRVQRTEMFMAAGGRANTSTRDVLEAKEALIRSQLTLTGVMVSFAVAKLQLLRDLEALPLEPMGLRYDPALRLPSDAHPAPGREPKTREDDEKR